MNRGNDMDARELRQAFAEVLEKLDSGELRITPSTQVTLENIAGESVSINLRNVAFGTLIQVYNAEYMKVANGTWVKYDGLVWSSENLAEAIREEQEDNEDTVTLIHIG
jgi:hypothetical protein